MFLFIRRFIFSILLAQWLYAEAVMLLPSSQPVLDTVTQFLKPPTHDKWIETYQAFQGQRASVVARAQGISESDLAEELLDTVEKLKNHNSFGSLR
jgi:hypothetical protein